MRTSDNADSYQTVSLFACKALNLARLLIESSVGPAIINLSAIETNPITSESMQFGLGDKLEAFMREQQTPIVDSPN